MVIKLLINIFRWIVLNAYLYYRVIKLRHRKIGQIIVLIILLFFLSGNLTHDFGLLLRFKRYSSKIQKILLGSPVFTKIPKKTYKLSKNVKNTQLWFLASQSCNKYYVWRTHHRLQLQNLCSTVAPTLMNRF